MKTHNDPRRAKPPMGLTLSTLVRANMLRLPQFKNSKGETAHSMSDGSDWTPSQWLQAVVGELGEYANFRKKFERGDITEEEFRINGGKELADTLIYLCILSVQIDVDLEQVTIDKFNEVSNRVGSSIFLDRSNGIVSIV